MAAPPRLRPDGAIEGLAELTSMSEIEDTAFDGDENLGLAFVGRVALAFCALVALGAMVVAMIALAYLSAPSEKRAPPISGGASASVVRQF
jgi:hypothetical protein